MCLLEIHNKQKHYRVVTQVNVQFIGETLVGHFGVWLREKKVAKNGKIKRGE